MLPVAMGQQYEGSLAGGLWQRRGEVGGCLRLPLGLALGTCGHGCLTLVDSGSVAIRQLGKTSQWVRSLAILQGMTAATSADVPVLHGLDYLSSAASLAVPLQACSRSACVQTMW